MAVIAVRGPRTPVNVKLRFWLPPSGVRGVKTMGLLTVVVVNRVEALDELRIIPGRQ